MNTPGGRGGLSCDERSEGLSGDCFLIKGKWEAGYICFRGVQPTYISMIAKPGGGVLNAARTKGAKSLNLMSSKLSYPSEPKKLFGKNRERKYTVSMASIRGAAV